MQSIALQALIMKQSATFMICYKNHKKYDRHWVIMQDNIFERYILMLVIIFYFIVEQVLCGRAVKEIMLNFVYIFFQFNVFSSIFNSTFLTFFKFCITEITNCLNCTKWIFCCCSKFKKLKQKSIKKTSYKKLLDTFSNANLDNC